MEHDIQVTRTHNEQPDVPDALHLRCSCGWSSSAHDQAEADALAREHRESSVVPAPPPFTPSPD